VRVFPAILGLPLAALAAAASPAPFPFFAPVEPPRSFEVMVHRGASAQAPENTQPALEHCIEDGLAWVEVDVRLTRDGEHVLAHDERWVDGAGRAWLVRACSLEELSRLDLGSSFSPRYAGVAPLSLKRCLALAKGRLNLALDCKAVDPAQLAREILEAQMERQVVVYDQLEPLRQVGAASRGQVALMAKWRPGVGGPEWASTHHLAAVEIDAPDLTAEVARAFRARAVKVQAKCLGDWDQPSSWDRALAAGADWIQTDLPEEVLARALWRRLPHRPVRFSLHRGAGRYAPENTLPAFTKAVRLGADFVELDVRASHDGQYFLLHDSRLDRTTDGTGPIAESLASVVRGLSAGAKFGRRYAEVRVPSLDDFLAAVPGPVELYVDAKAIPAEALVVALERHQAVERAVVYQSPDYLARLKALRPGIRRLPPLRRAEELDALVAQLEPYAVDADWGILSRELIERCHERGVRVFSDALGEHERLDDYRQAIRWGIDLIQTDHPLRLMRAIELEAG
jgi:glycerophosphoryl diester phosphodiesterase